jgi:hypothetical protein
MRTSLYSILCILIRLGAVVMAVTTIVTIPAVWQTTGASGVTEGFTGTLFAFGGGLLVLAVLLWIYPGVLARIAVGTSSAQVFESPLSASELQQIVLSGVGVWFAMQGLADLAAVGARIIVVMHMSEATLSGMLKSEYFRLVPLAIKVSLGIALALGSRGLVGFIRGLRERGLPEAVPESDAASRRPADG